MRERVLFLWGDSRPEVASLLRDDGFRAVVGRLLAGERAAAGDAAGLAAALRHGVLVDDHGHLAPGPALTLVPAAAERGLPAHLAPALERYVDVAAATAERLRRAYARTTPSHRFAWSAVAHTLVAGLFLDLAMGCRLAAAGVAGRRPRDGGCVIWAFEQVSAENGYGVRLTGCGERAFFVELWHREVRRSAARIGGDAARQMARLAAGDAGGHDAKALLYLKYLGLARGSGSGVAPAIPAFARGDAERLLPELTRGAARLVDEAVLPALAVLERLPWWRPRARQEAYRHAAVRLVLEYGIDRAVAAGVVAPFPAGSAIPAAWGRCLWSEPAGAPSVIPTIAAGQEEGDPR